MGNNGPILVTNFFLDLYNGYVVGNSGKIILTQDGGGYWTTPYSTITSNLNDIHFINSNKGYIVGGSQILETTNGGFSWYSYTSYPTLYQDLTFQNTQVGFAVGYYGTIMKTIDGGLNWELKHLASGYELRKIYFVNDTIGFTIGSNGIILRTTNGGGTMESYPK